MKYTQADFLDTADAANIELSIRSRELTREYYLCDYRDEEKKRAILEELLGKIGENVSVGVPIYCDHGKGIFIGDDVVIGMNCTFVDNREIYIGNRVMLASNVQIYTASHPVLPNERLIQEWQGKSTTFFRTYAQSVTIEDNVWIGGGAIILPGVTIGKNSVIGAGSVVTESIPENCVAVGNPCRIMRRIYE
ncbi:MAG: sugar O-acetyltransferase [Clostridia bacterium]|nr:sugar O-acetyltransferase [Clostridia bacterium]